MFGDHESYLQLNADRTGVSATVGERNGKTYLPVKTKFAITHWSYNRDTLLINFSDDIKMAASPSMPLKAVVRKLTTGTFEIKFTNWKNSAFSEMKRVEQLK
jgi:hypothetical protein